MLIRFRPVRQDTASSSSSRMQKENVLTDGPESELNCARVSATSVKPKSVWNEDADLFENS